MYILMKMLDPHILKMLKEEMSYLIEESYTLVRMNLIKRRSLFCTRCRCEDKCCDVIIDGGSTKNKVSRMMFTKLKLKR